MFRKVLLATLIATSLGSVPIVASARDIIVRVAPPPPRDEVVPAMRRGQAWVPGHWEWRRGQHIWVKGMYVRERRGYVYQPDRWVERKGGWYMERGRWGRGDRDGDGVRNRDDRAPNNPNRS